MNIGDIVESIHSGNQFNIEYISKDNYIYVLCSISSGQSYSRGYTQQDMMQNFIKVESNEKL